MAVGALRTLRASPQVPFFSETTNAPLWLDVQYESPAAQLPAEAHDSTGMPPRLTFAPAIGEAMPSAFPHTPRRSVTAKSRYLPDRI